MTHACPEAKGSNPVTGLNLLWAGYITITDKSLKKKPDGSSKNDTEMTLEETSGRVRPERSTSDPAP
jgi:hypothetical protein